MTMVDKVAQAIADNINAGLPDGVEIDARYAALAAIHELCFMGDWPMADYEKHIYYLEKQLAIGDRCLSEALSEIKNLRKKLERASADAEANATKKAAAILYARSKKLEATR